MGREHKGLKQKQNLYNEQKMDVIRNTLTYTSGKIRGKDGGSKRRGGALMVYFLLLNL